MKAAATAGSLKQHYANVRLLVTPWRMRAAGVELGLPIDCCCLSVCPCSLSNEGLVEGLVLNKSVRIQKILASTLLTDQRSTREAEKSCVEVDN